MDLFSKNKNKKSCRKKFYKGKGLYAKLYSSLGLSRIYKIIGGGE